MAACDVLRFALAHSHPLSVLRDDDDYCEQRKDDYCERRKVERGLPGITVDMPRRAPERVVRKMRLACS